MSSSTNSQLFPDVNVDGNFSQDIHPPTIISPNVRQTVRSPGNEDTGSIERVANGVNDFRIDQQSNVRRGTLLSPSWEATRPEDSSEAIPQYPLMQHDENYHDHTDLFVKTLADDELRRSLSYAGFRPDNSDDDLSTSYGRSHNNSNGVQISDDEDTDESPTVPSKRTVVEHIGDVLYSAVTLFECIPYVSVLERNYSKLKEEIIQVLKDLSHYVSQPTPSRYKFCKINDDLIIIRFACSISKEWHG